MNIVEEIVNSKEFQRLKKITLSGFNVFLSKNNPLYIKNEASIYEHSVGVYNILSKFNVSEEERIMGLLHDISKPAFGHIVDYVFGDKEKQEWHEEIMEDFLENSEIKKVLEKYGFNLKEMVERFKKGEYKYLDSPIPDICADRLDYSLRHIKLIFGKDLFWVLDFVKKNEVLEFKNEKVAYKYSINYLNLAENRYVKKHSALFEVISRVLKIAMENRIVTLEDFLTKGEKEIYDILNKDREIRKYLELIKNIKIYESYEDYDLIVKTKCRYVDPLVNNERLSSINKEFKEKINKFLKLCKEGAKVRIEPKEILKF